MKISKILLTLLGITSLVSCNNQVLSTSNSSSASVVSSDSTITSSSNTEESVLSSSVIKPTSLNIGEDFNLRVGESKDIVPVFTPITCEENVNMTVSAENYVEITKNNNGFTIKALQVTTKPITLTATSESGLKSSVNISIYKMPESLTIPSAVNSSDYQSNNYLSSILPISKSKEITIETEDGALVDFEFEFVSNDAEATLDVKEGKLNTFVLTAKKEGKVDFKVKDKANASTIYDQYSGYFYDDKNDESINNALASLHSDSFKSDNDLFSDFSFNYDETYKKWYLAYTYEGLDGTYEYYVYYKLANGQFTEIEDGGNDSNGESTIATDSLEFVTYEYGLQFTLENSDYEETTVTII